MINKTSIEKIIDLRTKDWDDLTDVDKSMINDYAYDVLMYCKENGIDFDETAGSVFVTHLTTLFHRIHEDFTMDLDEDMLSQIDQDLYQLGQGIDEITKRYYKKNLNESEIFLLTTHLGSMRERKRMEDENNG